MTAGVRSDPLAWRDGVPYCERYRDVYASRDGALGQARHVFLGGNRLPQRWGGCGQFVILETGFGLGVNFLATLEAWRLDPQRPRRLHYASVEMHPPRAESLMEAAPPQLQPLARALAALWPLPLPGLHRLEFEGGAVTLTLALGDAQALLPQLVLGADAIYLDGFAPERNPRMWTAPLLRQVARLARPGATAATWCAARAVRDALADAGFEIELRPGYGRKRQMLAARFAPRWRVRRHEPAAAYEGERRAIVAGAGLAGAHCAAVLAHRGWQVIVLEAQAGVAQRASGLPWGLLHPSLHADDSVSARLTRAGFLLACRRLAELAPARREALWRACGVALPARCGEQESAWRALAERADWPQAYARFAERDELAAHLGLAPRRGGWWFAQAGLVSPGAWCRALLEDDRIELRCAQRIECIERDGVEWLALGAGDSILARAPVLVLANALDAQRLAASARDPASFGAADASIHAAAHPASWLAAQPVRGRISYLRAPALAALAAGMAGDGYLVHAPDGSIGVGASYEPLFEHGEIGLDAVHRGNLQRLERLLALPVEARATAVFDGVRCVAPDRLPYAGALADAARAQAQSDALRGAHLADLPRRRGLYACFALGSRGLVLSALAAELIGAQIEGEPWPVERALAAAVDPGRRLLRALRGGRI